MEEKPKKLMDRKQFLVGVAATGVSLLAGGLLKDAIYSDRAASASNAPQPAHSVQVTDFGAVGDGKSDDTAALQAAIRSAVQAGKRLYIPGGTYKITNAIEIPLGTGFFLEGESHGSVTIMQYADNKPIFRFTTAYTSEWRISGISFTYNKKQSVNNTSAIPIYFDQPRTDSNGFWNFSLEWCRFQRGYIAIATNPKQQMAVWGVTVRNCIFESELSRGYIKFDPDPAVGQPNIRLENLYGWAGDVVAGPLVSISSADTVLIQSCEFNHLRCPPLEISSCPNVTVINTRCEDVSVKVAAGETYRFWGFPNSRTTVIGCEITNITVSGGGRFLCLSSNVGGYLNIIGFEARAASIRDGSHCYAWEADVALLVSQVQAIEGALRHPDGAHARIDVDRSTPDRYVDVRDKDVSLRATDAQYLRVVVQTANRTVKLPATGGYDGLTFTIHKANADGYALKVTDGAHESTSLPGDRRASVTYRCIGGEAWMPVHYSVFP